MPPPDREPEPVAKGPREIPNISRKESTRIQAEPQDHLRALLADARRRAEAAARERRALERGAARVRTRDGAAAFAQALRATDRVTVVAEAKRRSPSGGALAPGLDPVRYAESCVAGGARAMSVLTEPAGFGGSLEDLAAVARAVRVPALRKDFLLDEAQLLESRAAGASAVLLIARVLGERELADLVEAAQGMELGTLVETHDELELERVLGLRVAPTAIGVNARDLVSFAVDLHRVERLLAKIPGEVAAVAESGVAGVEDVESLAAAGADAVLVGTALVRAPDAERVVRQLAQVKRRGR